MELLHPWSHWTESLTAALRDAGFAIPASDCSAPPKSELGEVAIPFFRVAKERGQPPAVVAAEAAEVLKGHSYVQEAVAAGPYINARLSATALIEALSAMLEQERAHPGSFGSRRSADQGQVLFEYANPNTHKEVHIGHLRNFITGVAYHGLWKAAGVNVEAVQFVNDQGVNVAKTLWMLVTSSGRSAKSITEADVEALLQAWPADQRTGNALGKLYVESTLALDAQPEIAEDISWIQARLEAHDPAWEQLWRVTRDWCLDELRAICTEIGIGIDRAEPYLESTFLDEAAQIVDRLESSEVAKKSDGALIIDLEAEKLGVCMVRKSDGNLLYLSKDLALAEQKKRDYPDMVKSFILTDSRQALHFKQLNSVLQKMNYGIPYLHLDYALLTLKEGAMSSRKGNVVTYQDLRDSLVQYAVEQTRARHADWSDEQVQATARAIAFGGMKFALLKQSPNSIFTFDREQALSFDGMTGPYCQYAVVRLDSILKKAGGVGTIDGLSPNLTWEPAERELLMAISLLPQTLERALGWKDGSPTLEATEPATLAQWCFSTAQAVNAFYRDIPVLDAAPELRARRLQLALAAKQALTNGLRMLTIEVPASM